MKLTAKTVPYSSLVGGGLKLVDETGALHFLVMFSGTSMGISKEQTEALCKQVSQMINDHGLTVPSHEKD